MVMTTNQVRLPTTGFIALAVAASVLSGCTGEQIMIGQWYRIDTPPQGACPSLELRFVVDPQRSVGGVLVRDRRDQIAALSGVLNPDDSFDIKAVDATGKRPTIVTGRFTPGISTISIRGDVAGSACDGQTFEMYLGRYFSRQGGGGGGGRD